MIKCPNCRKANDETAAFCTSCGAPLAGATSSSGGSSGTGSGGSGPHFHSGGITLPKFVIPVIIAVIAIVALIVIIKPGKGGNKVAKGDNSPAVTTDITDDSSVTDNTDASEAPADTSEPIANLDDLLADADQMYETGKELYYAEDYLGAVDQLASAMTNYVRAASDKDVLFTIQPRVEEAFSYYKDSVLAHYNMLIVQDITGPLYEQLKMELSTALSNAKKLEEYGLSLDYSSIQDTNDALYVNCREYFIYKINALADGENWSRTEGWGYATAAADCDIFDMNNHDDPLTMRYQYCLAQIERKQNESLSASEAVENILHYIEDTDYSPILIKDLADYSKAAGDSSAAAHYEEVFNTVADIVMQEVGYDIRRDVVHFWYFSDISDMYSVSNNNGSTQRMRDRIRDYVSTNL